MKLIDKDALVAEINKRIMDAPIDCYGHQRVWAYNDVKDILDTLEVKEAKKESVSEELEEAIEKSFIYHESHGDDFRSDKQIETAYKYGFESGAKWADEHSIELKEADLEKEYEEFVVDDPIFGNFITNDTMGMKLAKHFFELGLKVQKRE